MRPGAVCRSSRAQSDIETAIEPLTPQPSALLHLPQAQFVALPECAAADASDSAASIADGDGADVGGAFKPSVAAVRSGAAAGGCPNLKDTTMQEMLSLLPRWKASLVSRTAAASAVGMFCKATGACNQQLKVDNM